MYPGGRQPAQSALDRPVWSEILSFEIESQFRSGGISPLPQARSQVSLMPGAAKSLAGLPLGTSAIVRRVSNGRPIARRLMELGLVPGTRVTVTRVAPLGDPLELRVRNYALSIRRTEALSIEVDETVV